MGTWGNKLYDNDFACDIRDDYINKLRIEVEENKIVEELKKDHEYELMDEEEKFLFWIALADTQWDYGRLEEKVKSMAIKYLCNSKDTMDEFYQKMKKNLSKTIVNKLETPLPKKKKVKKLKMIRPVLNTNSIYLYKLKKPTANVKFQYPQEWHGKYVALKVIGTDKYNIGSLPKDVYYHESDVFSVYSWIGDFIPTVDYIEKYPFLKNSLYGGKVDERLSTLSLYKDIDELGFECIFKPEDTNSQKQEIEPPIGIPSIHNFDLCLINMLKMADIDGTLVKDYK